MNRLQVYPTGADRSAAHGNYVVYVSPDVEQSEKLGKFAVICHDIAHGGLHQTLRAPCRVLPMPTTEDGPTNTDQVSPPNTDQRVQVRTDQTVRNAIGIPYIYKPAETFVTLAPLHISARIRFLGWVSRRLKVRQLFLRVAKSDPPDMEKELMRIPPDSFGMLGVGVGDRVVLEGPVERGGRWEMVRCSLPAYPLTKEICDRREALEECAIDARYPDAAGLLKVEPDIGSVFLDAWARSRLGVRSLDPVRARRDVLNLFLREVREFGIVFGVSLFGLASVLPKLAAIITAPLLALTLTVVNIRAKAGSPGSPPSL